MFLTSHPAYIDHRENFTFINKTKEKLESKRTEELKSKKDYIKVCFFISLFGLADLGPQAEGLSQVLGGAAPLSSF